MQQQADHLGLRDTVRVFSSRLSRKDRSRAEGRTRYGIISALQLDPAWRDCKPVLLQMAAERVMARAFREVVLAGGRVDGRAADELRAVSSNHSVFRPTATTAAAAADAPTIGVHGSAFFQRGDTHVLATTTLGPVAMTRNTRSVHGRHDRDQEHKKEHFYLQYGITFFLLID
jgi:polyribonucleotide nucleotidyltransferase